MTQRTRFAFWLRGDELTGIARTFHPALVLVAGLVPFLSQPGESQTDDTAPAEAERLFTLKVLPLLKAKCFACHSDDADELKGELNLSSRAGLLAGGETGEPAVVPGKPEESLLVEAVRWETLEMPPKENDRLSEVQIELLVRWIAAGAPWPDEERQKQIRVDEWSRVETADGVLVKTSGGLSDPWTYRRYDPGDLWAYRPIKKVEVPRLDGEAEPGNPIDAFISRKLRAAAVQPAGPADRRTLIRRATFDLTGLPPTPEEIDAFLADDAAGARQRLVDRLLASPHYGERMAQHWLDVVRYADTSGYSNDWERPHAWRYRDYVIRAFNEDKRFDRFVLEQIAGDELEPDDPEMRVAVGFLRMGPWEQTGMSVAAVTRQLWLDDVTNSVGETFLGHSLRCARCHDHKFDPIPTRDYYRIQAVFAGTQFAEADAEQLDAEKQLGADERLALWQRQMSEEGLEPKTELEGDDSFNRIKKKLEAYRELALARFEPKAFSVHDAEPQPVSILIGGSLESPREEVAPGVLSALGGISEGGLPDEAKGRRLALARWIASPENTLTARVIVNRVWQWHFGRGLVATPNNFGKMGGRPSHPELLDYLTGWFLDHGWSVKSLHRLIMTSDAYQRASEHPSPERLHELDPNGVLLAAFRPRRLTAEELRDAMLAVTGELSCEGGGPGVFPEINWEVALQPRHIMGSIAPPYRPSLTPRLRNRRTIYAFRYRGLSNPMLEVFNQPNADLSCERRDETTVATQAFALFNSRFAHDRALALAARLEQSGDSAAGRIDAAFGLLFGRAASSAERDACLAHHNQMQRFHREHPPAPREIPETVERAMIAEQSGVPFRWQERMFLDDYQPDLKPWDVGSEIRALADVCLVLLNSSEFLYVY